MKTCMEFDKFLIEVSIACGNPEERVIPLGNEEETGENSGEPLKLKLNLER